jgi:tetratricopeptide (TPR) repeat protein
MMVSAALLAAMTMLFVGVMSSSADAQGGKKKGKRPGAAKRAQKQSAPPAGKANASSSLNTLAPATTWDQAFYKRREILAKRDQLVKEFDFLERAMKVIESKLAPLREREGKIRGKMAKNAQVQNLINPVGAPVVVGRFATNPIKTLRLARLHQEKMLAKVQNKASGPVANAIKALDRLEDAEREWDELIQANDQFCEEWMRLADPFGKWSRSEREQSLAEMNDWISRDAVWAPAYVCRGLAHVRLKDFGKATVDFDKAIELDAESPEGWAAKAILLNEQGDKPGTKKAVDTATKRLKDSPFVLICEGMLRRRQGDAKAAAACFRRAGKGSKSDATGYGLLALTLATHPDDPVRDAKEALEAAAKASELTGSKSWWYLNVLAAAHAESGDFAKAVESIEQSQKLAPADAQDMLKERHDLYSRQQPLRIAEFEL